MQKFADTKDVGINVGAVALIRGEGIRVED